MSSGISADRAETNNQLRTPKPIIDGKTWLRHHPGKQSGMMDLLILEGKYTTTEIANRIGITVKRVEEHIGHLGKDGDWRSKISGMTPHNLAITKDIYGKIVLISTRI